MRDRRGKLRKCEKRFPFSLFFFPFYFCSCSSYADLSTEIESVPQWKEGNKTITNNKKNVHKLTFKNKHAHVAEHVNRCGVKTYGKYGQNNRFNYSMKLMREIKFKKIILFLIIIIHQISLNYILIIRWNESCDPKADNKVS